MIIHKQDIQNGVPMYEIITKKFKTITVKFDETLNDNDIYRLLSLLENDIDTMQFSRTWVLFSTSKKRYIICYWILIIPYCIAAQNDDFKVACPLTNAYFKCHHP